MKKGFTLIEILIVVGIIGILASTILYYSFNKTDRAYYERAIKEFNVLAAALELYAQENQGAYPADASRNVPAGLEDFLNSAQVDDGWPNAPWPGSVYDWDNWTINGQKVYQISIRFCPVGGPLSACKFPNLPWAAGFGVNSAMYYCLAGACRSHESEDASYPGYCVNCND